MILKKNMSKDCKVLVRLLLIPTMPITAILFIIGIILCLTMEFVGFEEWIDKSAVLLCVPLSKNLELWDIIVQ